VSSLQNESDVLAKPRTDKLPEDAKVSLRDAIPAKLLKKLREDGLAEKLARVIATGDADRAEWLRRQRDHLSDYDEFLESSAEGPFEGSSSLHLPMPLIVARALHARFLQAILGVEPYFNLKARTEGYMDRAALVTDVMSYALKTWCNYGTGVDPAIDTWLWNWVTTGTGILKLRWDCRYETFLDVQEVDEPAMPKAVPDEKGNPRLVYQKKTTEKEVEVTRKWFEGPVFEVVDAEDVLIVGGGGDPQLADSVHHTQFLTADELWTLADRGVFDEEAVRDVIDGGGDHRAGTTGSDTKQDRAANAGQGSLDTDADLDRYEIVESYVNYSVDGSGRTSKVVTWMHVRSRQLLRATYLRRINRAGEVPFFKIDFHRRPGQTYGVGIIEMLKPISTELDAMHNIRIDSGLIANMPMFFYRASSSVNPEVIPFEPGAGIPLDNPQQDVHIPQWGNKTAFFNQEEQNLQTLVERLTGINDMSLGVMSGSQGATRTASGVRALLGESNSNLDVFLRRLNRGWTQALRGLLHMLQQRIPAGLSFRVTGESGDDYWRQIRSAEDLQGDYDIEVSANTANSNKQIQLDTAQQVYQMTSNPLDYQIGVFTPGQRYEAIKNLLKQMGVKDYGRYVQPPAGYQLTLSPSEEVQRVIRGIEVPVAPNSDHQGFLTLFQEIVSSDELLGRINEEQTVALARHAQQHQQMMQAMAQQQGQVANLQQQAVNAQAAPPQSANPAANPMSAGGAAQGVGPAEAPPGA
jgi:hypothetical protein